MKASKPPLPKILRIGPYDIRVSVLTAEVADVEEIFGAYRHAAREIRLDVRRGSVDVAETLLHEINHAIWQTYALQERDSEERIVQALSTGQTQLLRDNPELVKWLAVALKEGAK